MSDNCYSCPFTNSLPYESEEPQDVMRQQQHEHPFYQQQHEHPYYQQPYYQPQYAAPYYPYYQQPYYQPPYYTPPTTTGAPSSPPPSFTPSINFSTPGTQTPCTNQNIYVWLNNGSNFWAWFTSVGRIEAHGYRWHSRLSTWEPYQVPLSNITNFSCH